MKKITLFSFGVVVVCALSSMIFAQKSSVEEKSVSATNLEKTTVAKQFEGKTEVATDGIYAPGEVKPNAKYYLILSSASRCAPCRAEMPSIVKEYEKISKNPDLELILVSDDHNKSAAEKWAKETQISFPTVLPGKGVDIKVLKLRTNKGIPSLMIVDAEGKVVAEHHPGILMKKYEQTIKEYQDKKDQ